MGWRLGAHSEGARLPRACDPSSGFAFTLGRRDGEATLDEVVEHTAALDRATTLPLSVDLENGYAAVTRDVARTVCPPQRRGHQPVQDVLDEVLTISQDELHVRTEEQGQNLAAVATDIGVDPQTLIDALVESWSPAIDYLLEAGQEATPTFSGLDT